MAALALTGGYPVKTGPSAYMAWPVGGSAEEEALKRVLHSGKWGTMGPEAEAFSREYADYCQARYGLAVLNGTVSLELLLRALEIGRGDEVIVPPYTFSATVHAVCLSGAVPVFADTDPATYTILPSSVEAHITPRTRAIIAVHLGGRPCDMDALRALARRHQLILIEDAAHAHGSEWNHKRTGSLADAGSFSFQASKNISCGEGGMITTDDGALYDKLWKIHNNGRDREDEIEGVVSTNGRMAEWQAAILRARMGRIDEDIETRMENAAYLGRELACFPFIELLRDDPRITRNSLHLFVFKYKAQELKGVPRSLFIRALNAENVTMAAEGYNEPIYKMRFLYTPDYQRLTGRSFENPQDVLPNNEMAAGQEGCWMYHSALLGSQKDMGDILEAVEKIAHNSDELLKMGEDRNG
jgi:dTDP-4-amino-4,6-dideoxygalactose transaminase